MDTMIYSFCNVCYRETAHNIVAEKTVTVFDPLARNDQLEDRVCLVVCCRGCNEYAVREEWRDHKLRPIRVIFQPPRLWQRPPDWLSELEAIDPDLVALLREVYSAANDLQVRLLSMGVRSALDHVMTKILDADIGSFEEKLTRMVENGHLTQKQRENLGVVIDAGSASTHRGFRPATDLLKGMVAIMERIIHEYFITSPMLQTQKMMIPPRPPRKKEKASTQTAAPATTEA